LLEDSNQMNVARNLVKENRELEKLFINVLVSLKNIKGAVKSVKEFDMNPDDFPLLVEQASFNASNYFVS